MRAHASGKALREPATVGVALCGITLWHSDVQSSALCLHSGRLLAERGGRACLTQGTRCCVCPVPQADGRHQPQRGALVGGGGRGAGRAAARPQRRRRAVHGAQGRAGRPPSARAALTPARLHRQAGALLGGARAPAPVAMAREGARFNQKGSRTISIPFLLNEAARFTGLR